MGKRLSVAAPPANSFPYPRFQSTTLDAVIAAIERAWLPIAEEEQALRDRRDEWKLNAALADRMDKLRRSKRIGERIAKFTTTIFETPNHDSATRDYTGRKVRPRPDITIRFRGRKPAVADPIADAIIIECKRMQRDHNVGRYIQTGMNKFIDGTYAWAVQQAMMVGYLERKYVLPDALERGLAYDGNAVEMKVVVGEEGRMVKASGKNNQATTQHQRTWTHMNGDAPGDIELVHVWLPLQYQREEGATEQSPQVSTDLP